MTRIKRGYIARRRRTKMRLFTSGFRGAHSRLTRNITQQKTKALISADRDRDRKKRDFRRLWISRINAVIRENPIKVNFSYNKFLSNLYKSQLLLNRKILAQMAILNKNCLYMIANEIIKLRETQLRKGKETICMIGGKLKVCIVYENRIIL
uniref:Large ribosomal subunit protein bL20c n=1 Tax=Bauhinia binata TaxID=653049 RepID=A0A2S0SV08_9FABA|nr:ribosomal protein L20 [Bauhinia binata]AWB12874.1 ribosomal protein L20 [Bauhinia binata]